MEEREVHPDAKRNGMMGSLPIPHRDTLFLPFWKNKIKKNSIGLNFSNKKFGQLN